MASDSGGPVVYVATATASDDEMRERIAHHRARRPATWITVETPTHLAPAVATILSHLAARPALGRVTVIVEDLTLLLANLMADAGAGAEARALAEVDAVLALAADVVLVSNEVGLGIVPAYPVGRVFRDMQGRLNQHAASRCREVYFLVAGLPLSVK